jgi:hypothetical protein
VCWEFGDRLSGDRLSDGGVEDYQGVHCMGILLRKKPDALSGAGVGLSFFTILLPTRELEWLPIQPLRLIPPAFLLDHLCFHQSLCCMTSMRNFF